VSNLNQEEKRKQAQRLKMEQVRKLKEISNPDSPWTLTQELLQDILASATILNPESKHEVPKLVKTLKAEIEKNYEDEIEIKAILLESIPSDRSVRAWFKKEGWEDAVWDKIRDTGLFTPASRAKMIDSLYKRGIEKSDTAAKLWLTLSGDYSDKLEVNDSAVEKFREINKILHKSKKPEDV
jgi:hypothetical protein